MKKEKPTKDSKKESLEPKKETLTLDMTEVILQGYQDDWSGPRSSGAHKS
tara:strand:+ start:251 stop:400 length:150 start_codon:yes stop_codon:yes gene_type:complete